MLSALIEVRRAACPSAARFVLRREFATIVDVGRSDGAVARSSGVYIVVSLGWLWVAESFRPDPICLMGADVIPWAPR